MNGVGSGWVASKASQAAGERAAGLSAMRSSWAGKGVSRGMPMDPSCHKPVRRKGARGHAPQNVRRYVVTASHGASAYPPSAGCYGNRSLQPVRLEPVHDLFIVPVAPQKWQMQGAKRSRAGGPASIGNAADATFAGQPFGQGSKKPHSSLRTLSRPPAWPAARA